MHYLILMHTCPIYQLHVLQSNVYCYHHNLMPVILVHAADTFHAMSKGSRDAKHVYADGERLARKVGKKDRRIKGGKAIFGSYADDGRQWRWRLGGRRRVDLHGDERFFTYKFGRTKKHKLAKQAKSRTTR